jgi:ABC-type polysaccharide/polyol phosphate transport system ATPase subunit
LATVPSIKLDHVGVSFPMFDGGARSLKRRLLSATTGGYIGRDSGNQIVVHALKDVSAQIEHGDRVALVGHNGAGKTTLLRVMAGIYEPMAGRVEIIGRVASLFDLSLGMDGDQTGSQNIMLRGMYLGLSKAEILARTDEIAEFTELGPFLDFPLRTYSAGMHARLGFAISTCVRPEILLLDEGISAGDAAFMQKAQKRVDEFVQEAGIVVLASHTEPFVRDTCNKAILLEHGQVVLTGSVDEVFAAYGRRPAAPG